MRRIKQKKHLIRCIVINDLEETDRIKNDLEAGNVVIFSIKKLRLADSIGAKRLIQRLKAIALEKDGDIAMIGPDLLVCSPRRSHELRFNVSQ
ncbi:MAG: cell division protein SepF [Candidatus Odinarchaeota archaeon]